MSVLQINIDVFIWKGKDIGLIYNSVSGNAVEFPYGGDIKRLVSVLLEPENLYTADLPEKVDEQCALWLRNITTKGLGRIYSSRDEIESVSFMPILKIQETTKHFKWAHEQHRDGNILNNIHSIVIDLGSSYGSDVISRQILFPSTTDCSIDSNLLIQFTRQAKRSNFFSRIHLVGDIRRIEIDSLKRILADAPVTFHMTYPDFVECKTIVNENFPNADCQITIRSCYDISADTLCSISKIPITFLIENEQDIDFCEQLQSHDINCDIVPVYNDNNYQFICDALKINKSDLFEVAVPKRKIFIAQTLNVFDFGRYYISPCGNVYTNPNEKAIGTLNNSPYQLTYKEFSCGISWLKTRDHLRGCDQCVYRYLCPSPSHYEQVLDCNMLCWRCSDESNNNDIAEDK